MGASSYVALLRGINVGGRNLISMGDLRAAFAEAGYEAVRTYIQSGNVLFASSGEAAAIEHAVEGVLDRRFGAPIAVVVRSHDDLRTVVERAPAGFGRSPDLYHCDTVFLKAPLTAERALEVVDRREGVDRAWAGPDVLYLERLSAERAKSRMSRIATKPEYRSMTIRNWKTTTTLLRLLEEHGGA